MRLECWDGRKRGASGDLTLRSAVLGISPDAVLAMGGFADGSDVHVPLMTGDTVTGEFRIGEDGESHATGVGIAVTSAPDRPVVMVACGALDGLALASLGFSTIAVPGDGRGYAEMAARLDVKATRECVTWWQGEAVRFLLRNTPQFLERATACLAPSEWANVHEWVRDGKAGRRDVIARVLAVRKSWESRAGRLSV